MSTKASKIPSGYTRAKWIEALEARAELRKILRPGMTVYGIVDSVSKSGMSRVIRFYCIKKNAPRYLTGYMARALGYQMVRGHRDGIRVHGCGMDMIFATVYDLGRVLWPKGGPLAKSNGVRQAQEARRGETRETDGGYLLRHDSL